MDFNHIPLDKPSFGEFFTRYYNELYAYANAILRDEDLARDLVQDVFLSYWENRHRIDLKKSPLAYFYTTVRNRCYNHFEHLQVERKGISYMAANAPREEHHNDRDDAGEARIEQVRQVLDRLPLQCKRVVILSCIEGLKYSEIAAEMSISVNTVRTHISRAYAFIRKTMPLGVFLNTISV